MSGEITFAEWFVGGLLSLSALGVVYLLWALLDTETKSYWADRIGFMFMVCSATALVVLVAKLVAEAT